MSGTCVCGPSFTRSLWWFFLHGGRERINDDAAAYWTDTEWIIMSWWKRESKQLCNKHSMVWSESLYPSETRRRAKRLSICVYLVNIGLPVIVAWFSLGSLCFFVVWMVRWWDVALYAYSTHPSYYWLIPLLLVLRRVSSAYFLLGSHPFASHDVLFHA